LVTRVFRVTQVKEDSPGCPVSQERKDLQVPRETGEILEIRECLELDTKEQWDPEDCLDYQDHLALVTRDRQGKEAHQEKLENVAYREVLVQLGLQVTVNFVMLWRNKLTDNLVKKADLQR